MAGNLLHSNSTMVEVRKLALPNAEPPIMNEPEPNLKEFRKQLKNAEDARPAKVSDDFKKGVEYAIQSTWDRTQALSLIDPKHPDGGGAIDDEFSQTCRAMEFYVNQFFGGYLTETLPDEGPSKENSEKRRDLRVPEKELLYSELYWDTGVHGGLEHLKRFFAAAHFDPAGILKYDKDADWAKQAAAKDEAWELLATQAKSALHGEQLLPNNLKPFKEPCFNELILRIDPKRVTEEIESCLRVSINSELGNALGNICGAEMEAINALDGPGLRYLVCGHLWKTACTEIAARVALDIKGMAGRAITKKNIELTVVRHLAFVPAHPRYLAGRYLGIHCDATNDVDTAVIDHQVRNFNTVTPDSEENQPLGSNNLSFEWLRDQEVHRKWEENEAWDEPDEPGPNGEGTEPARDQDGDLPQDVEVLVAPDQLELTTGLVEEFMSLAEIAGIQLVDALDDALTTLIETEQPNKTLWSDTRRGLGVRWEFYNKGLDPNFAIGKASEDALAELADSMAEHLENPEPRIFPPQFAFGRNAVREIVYATTGWSLEDAAAGEENDVFLVIEPFDVKDQAPDLPLNRQDLTLWSDAIRPALENRVHDGQLDPEAMIRLKGFLISGNAGRNQRWVNRTYNLKSLVAK